MSTVSELDCVCASVDDRPSQLLGALPRQREGLPATVDHIFLPQSSTDLAAPLGCSPQTLQRHLAEDTADPDAYDLPSTRGFYYPY